VVSRLGLSQGVSYVSAQTTGRSHPRLLLGLVKLAHYMKLVDWN